MTERTKELFPRPDESQKNAIVVSRIPDPKVPDPTFESLSWVLRARSRDPHRLFLCSLFSDGQGKFVSTDGHRLHISEIPSLTEKIPAGIWLYVHSDKKQISIQEAPPEMQSFPDFMKIAYLSDRHKKRGVIVYRDDTDAVWRYWDLTHIKCNIKYLLDICQNIEALDVFSADPLPVSDVPGAPAPQLDVIFFTADNGEGNTKKAVLMPLKG